MHGSGLVLKSPIDMSLLIEPLHPIWWTELGTRDLHRFLLLHYQSSTASIDRILYADVYQKCINRLIDRGHTVGEPVFTHMGQ